MRQKENSRNSGSEKFYSASSTLSADWQDSSVCSLLRHVSAQEVPAAEDLHSPESLQQHLNALCEPPYSVIVVGDIMLGGRAKSRLAEHGPDYPFAAVLPLLRRAPIVAGNLEGPFAKKARRQQRNFSYRVNPSLASALPRANINVLTLANNHLLDCGRSGVLETLDAWTSRLLLESPHRRYRGPARQCHGSRCSAGNRHPRATRSHRPHRGYFSLGRSVCSRALARRSRQSPLGHRPRRGRCCWSSPARHSAI